MKKMVLQTSMGNKISITLFHFQQGPKEQRRIPTLLMELLRVVPHKKNHFFDHEHDMFFVEIVKRQFHDAFTPIYLGSKTVCFVGLAYQGNDIVFRFIKEFCSLALFLFEDFWKILFWLVLKLEISYRVMISWRVLRGLFWRLYFCMVKYLNFHNSSFALGYFVM